MVISCLTPSLCSLYSHLFLFTLPLPSHSHPCLSFVSLHLLIFCISFSVISTPVLFHISNLVLGLFLLMSHTCSHSTSSSCPVVSMHFLHVSYFPSSFS